MPRPLRYAINVTLDGCVHHEGVEPGSDLHAWFAQSIAAADAMLLGRPTFELMTYWRDEPPDGWPDGLADFARAIGEVRKHVVSRTLTEVGWNAELLRGDLATAVRALKEQPGDWLHVGGVVLPTELARLGLIDEYEFVVHPRVAGHGPRLLEGVTLDLELVERVELPSGPVAMRFVPRT